MAARTVERVVGVLRHRLARMRKNPFSKADRLTERTFRNWALRRLRQGSAQPSPAQQRDVAVVRDYSRLRLPGFTHAGFLRLPMQIALIGPRARIARMVSTS